MRRLELDVAHDAVCFEHDVVSLLSTWLLSISIRGSWFRQQLRVTSPTKRCSGTISRYEEWVLSERGCR
jgi:hypothetical protein